MSIMQSQRLADFNQAFYKGNTKGVQFGGRVARLNSSDTHKIAIPNGGTITRELKKW